MMTTYVALLAAVNVGGNRRITMPELRSCFETAGATSVTTYIQSGNVVFTSPADPEQLTATLGDAIEALAGEPVPLIVRTGAELDRVVAANPFAAHGADPTQLHVVFLDQPAATIPVGLDLDSFSPEQVAPNEKELYLLLPDGIGRAKLPLALLRAGKRLDPPPVATTRNWRTTVKLLDLARRTGQA